MKCVFCQGRGVYCGHECDWCDGLGERFSDIVLRGHPSFEGQKIVLEGCRPVLFYVAHVDKILVFERATETEPPFWFVKEDGKQVYRFKESKPDASEP